MLHRHGFIHRDVKVCGVCDGVGDGVWQVWHLGPRFSETVGYAKVGGRQVAQDGAKQTKHDDYRLADS